MSLFVVATYFEDQAFGGPEEGGWWYMTCSLDDVIAASPNEDHAWYLAKDYNLSHDSQPRATVVELGRWEVAWEHQDYLCHGDGAELFAEDGSIKPEYRVRRWDIPEYTPEHKPHYC
jgi:hypothetical protein